MLYHPGYIPNTELPAVYSGASVFIYTSLRESFGIPILEAMACGTPVITSTTSAMPEITGPEVFWSIRSNRRKLLPPSFI